MKFKQGNIVEWKNSKDQKIIWVICDDTSKGVVIHSDNLLGVGTLTSNISEYGVSSFVGSVTIVSTENK